MESELGRKMEREKEWVKRWTTEFLGRRNPNWKRKCFRGEHWNDLEVSLQTGVCPVST